MTSFLRVHVWRPLGYGLGALPLTVVAVPMSLARRASRPGTPRVVWYAVTAFPPAVLGLVLAGFVAFTAVSGFLYPFVRPSVLPTLGHPFTPDPALNGAWGGTTLAGAWVAHALAAVPFVAAGLLLLTAVNALHRRLGERLLGIHPVGACPVGGWLLGGPLLGTPGRDQAATASRNGGTAGTA